jgi:hypothetical protein
MWLGGLVTGANLLLSLVVGLRLLALARRRWRLPELSLAVYFLMSSVVGTVPQLIVYSGLADPSLQVPDATARALLAIAVLGMAVGAAGVYVFTWKTFRPDRWWAKGIVAAGCAALAAGYATEALREGFAPVVFAGFGHWLGWAGRTAAMFGVAFESFRYWRMLRRRMRLGMAEPVVTNRFLLWSVWAACGLLNYLSDLAMRSVYVWITGSTTELVPEVLARLIPWTLFATMVLGVVSAATLFLTFFPTPAYRRWVESRAPSPA